jgi:hypothetical protein
MKDRNRCSSQIVHKGSTPFLVQWSLAVALLAAPGRGTGDEVVASAVRSVREGFKINGIAEVRPL